MPKIIENIREKLLSEAKRQVMENGYSAMTIRSVAAACGVGTGTVYNYFPSKDMLVASFILEDWMLCMNDISKGMSEAEIEAERQEVLDLNVGLQVTKGMFIDTQRNYELSDEETEQYLVMLYLQREESSG